MTFDELLNEIDKLVGLELKSIARAEGVEITEVDRENKMIYMVTLEKRKKKKWGFDKIELIWEELCNEPAVHVESVLKGSNSSRSQPETILANLPSVEWLKVNKLKHLSLSGDSTRKYGTVQKMDDSKAEKIKEKYKN
ncbi:hypothetical protein [Paenibacillus rhizophilus]|uniref:Uncharacterized protein n=1 Tax=Paenibacillus rhizophilus TaxID=1850366 RepID=A0A3N9NY11_9BACL|nr:hypothetical protein [Paenibacillus rhizophilus]RQW08833.1 hypothetical protein EH198_20795 [Paenibacillus rhizophilus]